MVKKRTAKRQTRRKRGEGAVGGGGCGRVLGGTPAADGDVAGHGGPVDGGAVVRVAGMDVDIRTGREVLDHCQAACEI